MKRRVGLSLSENANRAATAASAVTGKTKSDVVAEGIGLFIAALSPEQKRAIEAVCAVPVAS